MRTYRAVAFATFLATALLPTHGFTQDADDDDDDQPTLTRSSQNLPELILGGKDSTYSVNQTDFVLQAGQGYRWKITSGAAFEYKFHTDLFRDTWVNQIVINDLEVHMNGAPAWLEFDLPGTILVQFNTVRPGTYTWSVPDLADKGMKGTITVK